jgi:hypothetical protein
MWLVSSPDSLDVAPTISVFSIRIQQGTQEIENDTVEMSYTVTNTLGQIRSRTNTTSCTTTMVLFGWIDNID